MDIKIPSGPPEGGAVDAIKDTHETVEALPETGEASGVSGSSQLDAVSAVAEQVARGEIGREEAVDRILADVLDSEMVESAPEELKQELGEALRSLIDTDPYLQSLASSIGPAENE